MNANPSQIPSDDDLLALLRASQTELDPPPEHLTEVAMRALTWDTDFAALVAGNTAEESVLVRSVSDVAEPGAVDLVFAIDDSVLEVAVEADTQPGTFRLNGLVHPRCDRIRVVSPSGPNLSIECDSFGRFEAAGIKDPFALAFETGDGRLVRTELFDLP